jgi:hypothetical protein
MGLGMIMAGIIAEHVSLSAIFWTSSVVCMAGLIFFRFSVLEFYESHKN